MSRLVRYIAESSSDDTSTIQDKYDAESFGSQFDSDSSSETEDESHKGGYSYESDQDSHISLTPGEEYVLDTLFGWMDRPMCAAPEQNSLLLQSARASALQNMQNIKMNHQMYLKNHAENSDDDSDSDSDSFITQEAEEYSEGPEQGYTEAQDAPAQEDSNAADNQQQHKEDDKEYDEAGQGRNMNPVIAIPVGQGTQEIDQFHSDSQEDESDDSEETSDRPSGSEDETSAAHRVSFLNTVLTKKDQKVADKITPSNIFEPPSKTASKAALKKVPTEVKVLGNKAVDVPANVQVVSSKHARQKTAEAPEVMLTNGSVEVPLEVSVSFPNEIQTSPENSEKRRGRPRSKPSPINTDEELVVEKKPSLDSLAAQIAQQRNTTRNSSKRDPTPTRRDARSMREEAKEVKLQPEEQVQNQPPEAEMVHEVVDLTESREPPVGHTPQSPHVLKNTGGEKVREPRRNSRPDPAEASDPVADRAASKEQTAVTKANKEKPTRSKRLVSTKKSKKKVKKAPAPDVHPGQPNHDEKDVESKLEDNLPVKSVTVGELKEALSELSHPHPHSQQKESKVLEESEHIRAPSIDLDDTGEQYFQTQSSHSKHHLVASRGRKSPFSEKNRPLARSFEERQELRNAMEKRSAPVPHAPSRRHQEISQVSQEVIQYGPLPTNNQDNPIDIEEYMAQREMLNREAPRMDFSGTTASEAATESMNGVREQAESHRHPPSPRNARMRPEFGVEEHVGVADFNTVSNAQQLHKKSNYYFGPERSRPSKSPIEFGIRQPKQLDALARNDPAGHVTNHEYDKKKKSKKTSSSKSKSNLASIEDLKKLEKRIEEHFRNSYAVDSDSRAAVSTKELRMLERQLVLQLRQVEEKRAAKLERLRNKKKSSRQDILEAEVIAVEPKDEGFHSKKKSADFRDANRYEQLQALRLSKEMGRYMSKPSGQAAPAAVRYQGQVY